MAKLNDTTNYVDGVKVTMCAPRKPRKSEITYPIDKSRYTPWSQTVSKYTRGTNGVLGTVDRVGA